MGRRRFLVGSTPEEQAAINAERARKRDLERRRRIKASGGLAVVLAVGAKYNQLSPEEKLDRARANSRKQGLKLRADPVRWAAAVKKTGDANKAKKAAKAIAEGRVPGAMGRMAPMTLDQAREYREQFISSKHSFYAAVKQENARARRVGVDGRLTVRDIVEQYVAQQGYCAFCARPFGSEIPHIDHWVPLALGGDNHPQNIRLLHGGCNATKGRKHPEALGLATTVNVRSS